MIALHSPNLAISSCKDLINEKADSFPTAGLIALWFDNHNDNRSSALTEHERGCREHSSPFAKAPDSWELLPLRGWESLKTWPWVKIRIP